MDQQEQDLGIVAVAAGFLAGLVLWGWQQLDNSNLTRDEIDRSLAGEDIGYPWPVEHPFWSALIVFALVLVIGRAYLFMRRTERRD